MTPRETPQIKTRCVDVECLRLGRSGRQVERALLDELLGLPADRLVALRGASRWVQSLHKLSIPAAQHTGPWLRDGGVYVITGGLGGIALEMAEHFARLEKGQARAARAQRPAAGG